MLHIHGMHRDWFMKERKKNYYDYRVLFLDRANGTHTRKNVGAEKKHWRKREMKSTNGGCTFLWPKHTATDTFRVQSTWKMIDCGRIQFFKRLLRNTQTEEERRLTHTKRSFLYLFIFLMPTYYNWMAWALWSMNLPIYLISFELDRKEKARRKTLAMIYDKRNSYTPNLFSRVFQLHAYFEIFRPISYPSTFFRWWI